MTTVSAALREAASALDCISDTARLDAETLFGFSGINVVGADKVVGVVAAGNDAQAAAVGRKRVEIEGDFASEELAPIAV